MIIKKTLKDHFIEYCEWKRSLKPGKADVSESEYGINIFIHWLESLFHVVCAEHFYIEYLYLWREHLCKAKASKELSVKPESVDAYNEGVKGFLIWLADGGHLKKDCSEIVLYLGGSDLKETDGRCCDRGKGSRERGK